MNKHHSPAPRRTAPPTTKQLRYLRVLAEQRGQTFTPPKTLEQASDEIDRLLGRKRSTRAEIALENRPVRGGYAPGIRDAETTGYGSTARWA